MDASAGRDQPPFGAVLKRLRVAAGMTQEALAERSGLSAKAVSDLERDPTRRPRLTTVALLADALALSTGDRASLLAAARPGDVPPAGQTVARRGVLPRPLTPLVGRAGVTAAIAELLHRGDTQLLTLTGPGGVGKTRVAMEVARRVRDAFPGGVVFVDLTPLRDPALVLRRIGACLGIDERDATPLHARIVAALHDRRALVVLDNFEHLLPAATDVVALLEACPELIVLATSRTSLRVRAGRDYAIAPLAVPDEADDVDELARSPAVELFVDRAHAAGIDLPDDADSLRLVGDICRRLDGLPLALELAAARTRLLPPAALRARLDRQLAVLVDGPRDLPARQRTLRDAIAWSHDLLSEAQQAVLRRLAVFAGGCTLDAADAVCAHPDDGASVLDQLTVLVDSNLVRMRPPVEGDAASRVVLLETIREFSVEQLAAHGEVDVIRQRHADHFVTLAETVTARLSGSDAPEAAARLDAERDNLRAALAWLCDRADASAAVRLVGCLWPYWFQRGHLTEGRRWLRDALDLPGADAVAAPLRLAALVGSARLAIDQADHDAAQATSAAAVTLARAHGDPHQLVAALNVRGHVAQQRDRYADAVRDYHDARALAHAADDGSGEAEALRGLAAAAMFTGDTARARDLADDSLTVARTTGDDRLVAQSLWFLAWQATNTGDHDTAEALASESLDRWQRLGDTGEVAELHFQLANAAMFRGDHHRADQSFREALALHRHRGDVLHLSRDLSGVGAAALNLADLDRARAVTSDSLELARRHDDRWGQAMSLTILAHIELARGADGHALQLLAEAAGHFGAIGNLVYMPWCIEGLAGVAAARGDPMLAAELDGARETVAAQVGVALPPIHPDGYARTLTAMQTALTATDLENARTTGRSRPLDQTIARAITGRHIADTAS